MLKQGLTVLLAAWWLAVTMPVVANEAKPMSNDPVLEARVMVIAEELRCLVCQNETIAASHADLAVDLRSQIRIKLTQGQSSQQILDFMVARYGEFVRYRPRYGGATLILWLAPVLLLFAAIAVLILTLRSRSKTTASGTASLSAQEQARLQSLLEKVEQDS